MSNSPPSITEEDGRKALALAEESLPKDAVEFRAHIPFMGVGDASFTVLEQKLITLVSSGMSAAAAGRALGYRDNQMNSIWVIMRRPHVKEAVEYFKQLFLERVQFSMSHAHQMYMEAWSNCETATEQVKVTDSLVKLHGVGHEANKSGGNTVNINVTEEQLAKMDEKQLLELAGQAQDALDPKAMVIEGETTDVTESYEEIEDGPSEGDGSGLPAEIPTGGDDGDPVREDQKVG